MFNPPPTHGNPDSPGGFDADASDLTEGSHPGEHLPIALPGRSKALASQNTVAFIDEVP